MKQAVIDILTKFGGHWDRESADVIYIWHSGCMYMDVAECEAEMLPHGYRMISANRGSTNGSLIINGR